MNYGLALSGGGTRGAAHAGVLLALEEAQLLPSSIAGTSAGSIIAGLYAAGRSPSDIKDMVLYFTEYGEAYVDPDCINILKLIPQILTPRPITLAGLIKGNKLLKYWCRETDGIAIKDAKLPLVIPAVDLNTGNTIAFTNVPNPIETSGVVWDKEVYEPSITNVHPPLFSPKPFFLLAIYPNNHVPPHRKIPCTPFAAFP